MTGYFDGNKMGKEIGRAVDSYRGKSTSTSTLAKRVWVLELYCTSLKCISTASPSLPGPSSKSAPSW
jgi:hypothetical protein